MADRPERRLAAILAADVVGYSRLMGTDEAGTRARFNALLDQVVNPAIAEHRGRLVKTMGDGFLVEFASVVDAVQCAADIQAGAAARASGEAEDRRMQLRIGIHLGDVIVEGDDIHGDGVNIAARLEALAEPGGICVSDMVHAGVRGKLALDFADTGEQSLKNIAEPARVYKVVADARSHESAAAADAIFRRPAVAVLPFENLSGDAEQDYFADGLTEDIITALSLWRSFPVIARNSTFAYKGQSPDIRKVGEELGARYVIEGSVRKAGDRVRVTAQLINAETGHHVWAERYDRDLADIFAMQDEITRAVAGNVAPEIERAGYRLATEKTRADLSAWDFVQRGMADLYEFSRDGNARARTMFRRAIELDPRYARAHSAISMSRRRDLYFRFVDWRDEIADEMLESARRGVELDHTDSMARHELGAAYHVIGRYDDAVQEFRTALNFNPCDAFASIGLGFSLVVLGEPEEGIRSIRAGLELNPRDPRNHIYLGFMARGHFSARRYDEAVNFARDVVRTRPDSLEAHLILASALGHLDQIDDARAELAVCESLHPGYADPANWILRYATASDNAHFLDGLAKAGWEG